MNENQLAKIVCEACLKIHKALGAGLLESAYEACLAYELKKAGVTFEQQKSLPVVYDSVKLDVGYRLDILVENKLIVELKSVEQLHPIHSAQLLTYLRLSGCKLGLLINFNVPLLKDGIKRFANGLED